MVRFEVVLLVVVAVEIELIESTECKFEVVPSMDEKPAADEHWSPRIQI